MNLYDQNGSFLYIWLTTFHRYFFVEIAFFFLSSMGWSVIYIIQHHGSVFSTILASFPLMIDLISSRTCHSNKNNNKLKNIIDNKNTFWFIDPVTDIIGRFLSWLGSRIFTFGNVSRDTSLIIGQSGLIFFHYI